MTHPYVERYPDDASETVRIWLDDSWLLSDRDDPLPKPDLTLTVEQMNALIMQWLRGPAGPTGPLGPKGDQGYPLDIDVIARLEALEERLNYVERDHPEPKTVEEPISQVVGTRDLSRDDTQVMSPHVRSGHYVEDAEEEYEEVPPGAVDDALRDAGREPPPRGKPWPE
jgi:hypothetical protein